MSGFCTPGTPAFVVAPSQDKALRPVAWLQQPGLQQRKLAEASASRLLTCLHPAATRGPPLGHPQILRARGQGGRPGQSGTEARETAGARGDRSTCSISHETIQSRLERGRDSEHQGKPKNKGLSSNPKNEIRVGRTEMDRSDFPEGGFKIIAIKTLAEVRRAETK